MSYTYWWSLVVVLLLSACAGPQTRTPVKDPRVAWQQRQDSLAALTHWRIEGSVSIKSPQERASLGLDWRQAADDYDVRFVGPFGKGAVRLLRKGSKVTFYQPSRPILVSSNMENLLSEEVGWAPPVSQFKLWLKGTVEKYAVPALDPYGRVLRFHHDGWTIEYKEYQQALGLELPKRIDLSHQATNIRVVIKQWHRSSIAKPSKKRFSIPE